MSRRNIRKSEKFKINIYIDINKIRDLYELHKVDISKKKGVFKPLKFFMNLIEIIPPENIKLYVAYIDGKFAAGLLLLYYNKTVEYITPVINEEYKSYQVLSKIIFEAMVDASIKGFKIWNWGGTWIEQESVHRFKKRWGSKQLTYSYLTTVNKKKLLNYKRDFILKKYPFSYVLPFDKL